MGTDGHARCHHLYAYRLAAHLQRRRRQCEEYIKSTYGADYYPEKRRFYKSRNGAKTRMKPFVRPI